MLTPDVMITLTNREKTGRMGRLASIQWKYRTGFTTVGDRSSNGSIMRQNPEKLKIDGI